ncbi:unnamed protein product, partial [marine sediment metagenome]
MDVIHCHWKSQRTSAKPEALVASQDIRPGSVLSEDMLETRDVPQAVLP